MTRLLRLVAAGSACSRLQERGRGRRHGATTTDLKSAGESSGRGNGFLETVVRAYIPVMSRCLRTWPMAELSGRLWRRQASIALRPALAKALTRAGMAPWPLITAEALFGVE